MKFFLFILFLLPNFVHANQITCKFEEVYSNGEIQLGNIYIQDQNLRYEYFNLDLYTLIFKNNKLYFIRNREPEKFEKITKNLDLFSKILEIYEKFPNIELEQKHNDIKINVELNKKDKFIKRLAILSQDLNLSIYFIDCSNDFFDKEYFSHNPFKKVLTIDKNIF